MLLNFLAFPSLTYFIKVSDNPLSLNVPLTVTRCHIVSNYRAADFVWPQGWHCAKSTNWVDLALALQEVTKISEGGLPCVKYTKH